MVREVDWSDGLGHAADQIDGEGTVGIQLIPRLHMHLTRIALIVRGGGQGQGHLRKSLVVKAPVFHPVYVPHPLVKSLRSTVQVVGTIIERQLVGSLTWDSEPPMGDAIGDATDDRPHGAIIP